MKKMDLKEIKECEFETLCYIDSICKKMSLRYTLIGGSLLGAVRHNGFIPWDDDIDISMPRPDYEKIINYLKDSNSKYQVVCSSVNSNYKELSAKVFDSTTVIEDTVVNRFNFHCGVYIDIFPVDGLGNSYKESLSRFRKSAFERELLNAANWKKYERSKTRAFYYELIRFPFYLLSRVINPDHLIKKIEKRYSNIDFDKSKYVIVISGVYREKEIMQYEVYRDYIELSFEGKKFSCIKQYDIWLSKVFGNYMSLPPKEKQVSHHTFIAYRKEN